MRSVHKTRRKKKSRIFTRKNYRANDGMMTSIWGPSLWHFLHTMSFNYPVLPNKREKKQYKDFMVSVKDILPCKYCRDNLRDYYKRNPLNSKVMKSRDTFSRYVYNLHEDVNRRLKKKSNISYYDVRDLYEHFRARCSKEKRKSRKQCADPLNGKKSKCILSIVPMEKKCQTFTTNI